MDLEKRTEEMKRLGAKFLDDPDKLFGIYEAGVKKMKKDFKEDDEELSAKQIHDMVCMLLAFPLTGEASLEEKDLYKNSQLISDMILNKILEKHFEGKI
jgi:hypothetical protein